LKTNKEKYLNQRITIPIVLGFIYILLNVLFLFNSGAGHDWGTGAMFLISMPLGLLAVLFESLFPHSGFIVLAPALGFFQYLILGYVLGIRADRR
jgi:hypothetical protein